MWLKVVVLSFLFAFSFCYVTPTYETKFFKVGVEYDHSLPMSGGSDRYRHRNNYEPFFMTVSTTAKKNYVITYLEVSATVDALGQVDFCLLSGQAGSRSMTFQLSSNYSDFLTYNYQAYGIKEEEYKKISNIITIPLRSGGRATHTNYSILFINTALLLFTHIFIMK